MAAASALRRLLKIAPNRDKPPGTEPWMMDRKPSADPMAALRDRELEAWLDRALGAKADPEPVLRDV
jgi:hypothetical protein